MFHDSSAERTLVPANVPPDEDDEDVEREKREHEPEESPT